MTLTEREKFIIHFIGITTMRNFLKEMYFENDQSLMEKKIIQKDVDIILSTRCRKLKKEEVSSILEDIYMETLVGAPIINEHL